MPNNGSGDEHAEELNENIMGMGYCPPRRGLSFMHAVGALSLLKIRQRGGQTVNLRGKISDHFHPYFKELLSAHTKQFVPVRKLMAKAPQGASHNECSLPCKS